jgi:hypothetical protein
VFPLWLIPTISQSGNFPPQLLQFSQILVGLEKP